MAKEVSSLCPERNVFVSGEERKISDKAMAAANFERTPLLSASLRWIIPAQENFATKVNITGVGERISRRFWLAGLNAKGEVESVRSVSVSSFRAMALGKVVEGVAAPVISTTINADGALRTAPGTSYIHAMEDTSWIRGENNLYVTKSPVAIRPAGSAEVYQAKFVDGKMQAVDNKVELETRNMKFFVLESAPTDTEVNTAVKAIKEVADDNFYAL